MEREADRNRSTADDVERVVEEMRARAVELWGQERADAIEPTLRRAALAVSRLTSLKFEPGESPAFFLSGFDDAAPGGALPANDSDE